MVPILIHVMTLTKDNSMNVLHLAIFHATCLAMAKNSPLRDMLHYKTLEKVIAGLPQSLQTK